jgi:hypothetical protein
MKVRQDKREVVDLHDCAGICRNKDIQNGSTTIPCVHAPFCPDIS